MRKLLLAALLSAAAVALPQHAAAQAIPSGVWVLTDLAGAAASESVQSTMSFTENGQVTGSGGCNRYAATFAGEMKAIRISAVAGARRSCAPAVMDQEQRFFRALQAAERLTREGKTLSLHAKGYAKPFRFVLLEGTEG